MIFLILSILASIGLFVLLRMFSSYHVHTRQAIMINYLVAGTTSLIVFRPEISWLSEPWFGPSCLLGILFYLIFRVMAKVTQINGVAVASVASKMSVVIPVVVGLTFLHESLSWMKLVAIVLGLVSIILSTDGSVNKSDLLWPVLLFLGGGTIDASLKLFQHVWVSDMQFPVFVANVFLSAFITAFGHHLLTHERSLSGRTWIGGLALGLVNFGALYFILEALALPQWESSVLFPVNNLGIIVGSTALAVFVLKERLTVKGSVGFLLACCSIALLLWQA